MQLHQLKPIHKLKKKKRIGRGRSFVPKILALTLL